MLKMYKNRLFEVLNKSDLGLSHFQMDTDDKSVVISVKNTPLQFKVTSVDDLFIDSFRIEKTYLRENFPLVKEQRRISGSFYDNYNIDYVCGNLKVWINKEVEAYMSELTQPDLWEQYTSGNKLLNIVKIDFNDRSSFSLDERKQIALAFDDLKLLINNKFELQQEELELINKRLDYLVEAADRLNKFDWKSILTSTIMSIIIALSLDTQKGHELYLLFQQVLGVIPYLLSINTSAN